MFSEVPHAVDLRLLGRYAEAESIQTRNVHEYDKVPDRDHQDTLRAQHNLVAARARTRPVWDFEPQAS